MGSRESVKELSLFSSI